MSLLEVVRLLSSFPETDTIYASEPWSVESIAIVAPEPEMEGLPAEAGKGMSYFLEVSVAREFLDGWLMNQVKVPPVEAQCIRLIQYAITDA